MLPYFDPGIPNFEASAGQEQMCSLPGCPLPLEEQEACQIPSVPQNIAGLFVQLAQKNIPYRVDYLRSLDDQQLLNLFAFITEDNEEMEEVSSQEDVIDRIIRFIIEEFE